MSAMWMTRPTVQRGMRDLVQCKHDIQPILYGGDEQALLRGVIGFVQLEHQLVPHTPQYGP